MTHPLPPPSAHHRLPGRAHAVFRSIWSAGAALALALSAASSWGADAVATEPEPAASRAKKAAAGASASKPVSEQVREAVEAKGGAPNKRLTLVINGKEKKYITLPAPVPSVPAQAPTREAKANQPRADSVPAVAQAPAARKPIAAAVDPQSSRQYIRARAAALSGPNAGTRATEAAHEAGARWSYEGENGPQAWGRLKPEFQLCASGKRQSPINIDEFITLQGPAEALQFNYQPSGGSVLNNGHTLEVEVLDDNLLTVRGVSYKLVQFHFHHPSEEQVNGRNFAMEAHLVHRSAEGQLAVLAVLLEPGDANALINRVWTHLPLDHGDRVRVPAGLLDLSALLPRDQRYYQFMGSLTTPPCTEGVMWLVLKQPVSVSPQQIKLFSQLFPHNARPIQPLHGRAVRDAQ